MKHTHTCIGTLGIFAVALLLLALALPQASAYTSYGYSGYAVQPSYSGCYNCYPGSFGYANSYRSPYYTIRPYYGHSYGYNTLNYYGYSGGRQHTYYTGNSPWRSYNTAYSYSTYYRPAYAGYGYSYGYGYGASYGNRYSAGYGSMYNYQNRYW